MLYRILLPLRNCWKRCFPSKEICYELNQLKVKLIAARKYSTECRCLRFAYAGTHYPESELKRIIARRDELRRLYHDVRRTWLVYNDHPLIPMHTQRALRNTMRELLTESESLDEIGAHLADSIMSLRSPHEDNDGTLITSDEIRVSRKAFNTFKSQKKLRKN